MECGKDYSNGTLLGQPDFYISYVGFKLGTWDKEKNEVKVNPNAKAADKRVRQAFGYAVDWDQLNEKSTKDCVLRLQTQVFIRHVQKIIMIKMDLSSKKM